MMTDRSYSEVCTILYDLLLALSIIMLDSFE